MAEAPQDLVRFCREQHPRLVGILSLYIGDAAVAEELAQEALLRAARHWDRVRSLDAPGGWVYRVAINLANSHFRRRRVERRVARRLQATATASVLATADQLAVRQAVAGLPRRQREVVVLRHLEDLSVADVAALLQVTHDAVMSLTKRAMAALRSQLVEEDVHA